MEYLQHYTCGKRYRVFKRQLFEETINLMYESLVLVALVEGYEVLSALYGKGYMDPMAWDEEKRRHGFYATDVSYDVYKKRFAGLFRPIPLGRDIVLFGD